MNYNVTYKTLDAALNAQRMFELKKQFTVSLMDGQYRNARKSQKELAKIAATDFDTYKTVPNFKFSNLSLKDGLAFFWKGIKYSIFRAFTKKTPEEKQVIKQYKAYKKTLTPEEKNKKTININLPYYY